MSIQISSENQQFLDAAVASGTFPSHSAAIDRALGLLRQRKEAVDRILARPIPMPQLPAVLEWQSPHYIGVRGHRVGLHLILDRFFAGANEAEIHDLYPTVPLEDLRAVMTFVRSHPEPMRAYLDQQLTLSKLLEEVTPQSPGLPELKARWEARFGRSYPERCP